MTGIICFEFSCPYQISYINSCGGGGGGAGLFGGGGGGGDDDGAAGGGGGSSNGTITTAGSGTTAGNNTNVDYADNAGQGGSAGTGIGGVGSDGNPGRIVLIYELAGVSVTYNGVALTLLKNHTDAGNNTKAAMWYMKEANLPAAGTYTVEVSLPSAVKAVVGATSWSDVHQINTFGPVATNSSISSTNPTVNVTSASGELVHDVVAVRNATLTAVGASQTQHWNQTETTSGGDDILSPATHTARNSGGCTDPTFAFSSDDSRTDCDGNAADKDVSDYHNFGFSIPVGVTITGIRVGLEHNHNNCAQDSGFWNMTLRNDVGDLVGTTKLEADDACHDTDRGEYYGGSSDLWGTTWTPAQINDTDFGLAINYTTTGGGGGNDGQADHVNMTVYYSAGDSISGGGSTEDGASTVTMNWTSSASKPFAIVAVALKPTLIETDDATFIQPDAGAPGMKLAIQFIGGTYSATDVITTDSSDIVVGPVVVTNEAGNNVTSGGRVLTTTFFINSTATAQTVQVTVDGKTLLRTFEIVIPAANSGNFTGQSTTITHPLGNGNGLNGTRTVGGTIVLDSLIVPAGVTVNVTATDIDPTSPGNQGYLPAIIIVDGDVDIQGTLDISGSAGGNGGGEDGGDGGDGGPGGGAGGGGGGDRGSALGGDGGDGFTGGGGGSVDNNDGGGSSGGQGGDGTGALGSSNSGDDGGAGGDPLFGNATGAIAGFDTDHGGAGGGGGTGFVFGSSGGGGSRDDKVPLPCYGTFASGGGGGSCDNNDNDSGGGGFGTAGQTAGGGGPLPERGPPGNVTGIAQLVPIAGGSGAGGAGQNDDGPNTNDGAGGGGGGAGALLIYGQGNFDITGAGIINAKGGAGGVCTAPPAPEPPAIGTS